MDIVIEGPIAWIDDPRRLRRIGAAYQDKYGWPVTVVGDRSFVRQLAGHVENGENSISDPAMGGVVLSE